MRSRPDSTFRPTAVLEIRPAVELDGPLHNFARLISDVDGHRRVRLHEPEGLDDPFHGDGAGAVVDANKSVVRARGARSEQATRRRRLRVSSQLLRPSRELGGLLAILIRRHLLIGCPTPDLLAARGARAAPRDLRASPSSASVRHRRNGVALTPRSGRCAYRRTDAAAESPRPTRRGPRAHRTSRPRARRPRSGQRERPIGPGVAGAARPSR